MNMLRIKYKKRKNNFASLALLKEDPRLRTETTTIAQIARNTHLG